MKNTIKKMKRAFLDRKDKQKSLNFPSNIHLKNGNSGYGLWVGMTP